MTELKEGMKAPFFEGTDQDGQTVKLTDLKGKKVVLYFYPKDNTPGCTAEACNLRDNYDMLALHGFEVVGVSTDTGISHKGFAAKYSLPFRLIADTSKKIVSDYGVYREKKLYGRSFLGIVRTTFLIDEHGSIKNIISKVETRNHSDQILKIYVQ